VKRLLEEIAARSDCSFEALEVDQDHLHGLVKSEPRISPLAIGRKLKQAVTFALWQRQGAVLKGHFWSDGYVCCTIGNARQETICQSIESQG
jgi:putative transposase